MALQKGLRLLERDEAALNALEGRRVPFHDLLQELRWAYTTKSGAPMKPMAVGRSRKKDPCPNREAVHPEEGCPMHPCATREGQVRQGR